MSSFIQMLWRLQMSYRKCSTRARFEISFKCCGAVRIRECDGCFNPPRFEFRSVWNFARIVLGQAGLQVLGQPNVEMFASKVRFQNVNVPEFLQGLRLACPAVAPPQRARSGPPTLDASARHPSPARRSGEGWWSRGDSNP